MDINRGLFQNLFKFHKPTVMLKDVYNTGSRKKNNSLVDVMKCGLSDLKDEIGQMSKEEIKIERPDKIVDIIEKILEFNRQN